MSGPDDAPEAETLDLVVPASLAGVRVDRVLSMLTGLSRAEAHQVLIDGALSLDGRVARKGSTLVVAGQHLIAALPATPGTDVAPDASVNVAVVLEDPDFVVVDKAPGQVVHPGAGQRDATLVAGLVARYPELTDLAAAGVCDPMRPGVVHRLDKGTSGVLVVARTPAAFVDLSRQLADRTMERTYVGMVEGLVVEERGVVDAPIGRSTRTPTLRAVRADGRPARTAYEVVTRLAPPGARTLLRLRLETGRTHQIRVHLATIGHPVVNDLRYGHRREPRLAEDRFFLHSRTLTFTHPRTGERVTAEAPLPADLAAMVPPGVEV